MGNLFEVVQNAHDSISRCLLKAYLQLFFFCKYFVSFWSFGKITQEKTQERTNWWEQARYTELIIPRCVSNQNNLLPFIIDISRYLFCYFDSCSKEPNMINGQ